MSGAAERRPARIAAVAFCGGLALLLPWLGAAPLGEPSEARYGVAAAEMFRGGDWLTPRIDGLLHFTKPPLAYWLAALSARLLGGPTEFALRLPMALCGALLAAAVALCAAHLGAAAGRAAFWLATAPGFLLLGRLLLTDMPLALATTLFFLPLCALAGERATLGRAGRVLLACAVAAGFLAKGPVFFLWTLLPLGLLAWRSPFWRARLAGAGWRLPYALGLAAAFPWFLAAMLRHPDLWRYFLFNQSVKALVGAKELHDGPPVVYYLGPLLLLVIGFWPALLAARRAPASPARALLLAWAAGPLAALALIPAKHETYILPALAPLAILAALAPEPPGRLARAWGRLVPGALALTFLGAQWLLFAAPRGTDFAARPRQRIARKYLRDEAQALAAAAGPGAQLVLVEMHSPSLYYYLGRPLPLVKPTISGRFTNAEPARTFFPERHATLEEFWAACDRPVLVFYRRKASFFAARHPEARVAYESARLLALAPDPARPRTRWNGTVADPEDAARRDLGGGRGSVADFCGAR